MTTYDYTTGQITRDFKFVKFGEVCRLRGVGSMVGKPGCKKCPFNGGVISTADCKSVYEWTYEDSEDRYVKCKHKEAKDSPDSEDIRYWFYEKFKEQAYAAYYD